MFLHEPDLTPARQALYDEALRDDGYIKNSTRAWAWQPELIVGLFDLLGKAAQAANLSYRDKGILVTACASALGDASCSLGWGTRLAGVTDADTAAAVVRGEVADTLTTREAAMAAWARQLATDPNATSEPEVARLRTAGLSDAEIFAITVYIALRIAFSTVNDGIGTPPDFELVAEAPPELAGAVDFGRPPESHT